MFVCKGSDSKKGSSKEGNAAPRLEGIREGVVVGGMGSYKGARKERERETREGGGGLRI